MSEPSASSSIENAALALRIVDDQIREFRTEESNITLGADPACTIQLSGDEVAPLHCLIVRDQNQTLIRNLCENSLLNEQPFRDEVLGEGDVIRIADTTIEVLSSSIEQLSMEQPEPVAAFANAVESRSAEVASQAFQGASAAAEPSASLQPASLEDNNDHDFAAAFGSGVIGASAAPAFESKPAAEPNPPVAASTERGLPGVTKSTSASRPVQSMVDAACETSACETPAAADANLQPETTAAREPVFSDPVAPESVATAANPTTQSPAAPNEEDPFEALKRMSAQAASRPVVEPIEPAERAIPTSNEPRNDDGSVDVSSVLSQMGTTIDEAPEPPVAAPPEQAFTPEEPKVEADSSIEDYMQQLLQRNGIESSAVEQSTTKVAPQPVAPPKQPEVKVPRKKRPRVAAPERQSDLTALRELANQSSRTAITRHARTSRNEKTLSSFLGSIACALCGLIMLVLSNFDHLLFMLIGFGMIALAGFLMLQAVKAGVFTRVKFKPKGPAAAQDTGVPHQRRRRKK